jgi:hypothetical protein
LASVTALRSAQLQRAFAVSSELLFAVPSVVRNGSARQVRRAAQKAAAAELWRVLVQGEMGPNLLVTGSIVFQNSAQVSLSEHDYMIEAIATNRSDEALG